MKRKKPNPKGTCALCWAKGLHITVNPEGTCPRLKLNTKAHTR